MAKNKKSKKNVTFKLKHPQTVAATLSAAADLIDEVGWCRGTLKDADGRVCALGAINALTVDDRSLRESVYCTYAKYLKGEKRAKELKASGKCAWSGGQYNKVQYNTIRRDNHQSAVTSFNDRKNAKDVKKTLRECADLVRKNA